MRRILSTLIICIFTISMLGGCSVKEEDNVVNISILNSKPEIEEPLKNVIDEFTKENSDINIKLVKYNQSGTYMDKLKSMESNKTTPTISLVDTAHIDHFKSNLVDLSLEEWVKDISGEPSELSKNDEGNIIAFPFSVEGVGFIYNKKVIQEAGIDVSKINTIDSLEEAFKKVEAIGKKALVITNEEWSLGNHFMSTIYAADIKSTSFNGEQYFSNLMDTDLKNNNVLNGVLNTFDIMKKYNMYASNPLAPSYDKCAEVLENGEVAFWYMGNWAFQGGSKNNSEFGILPVPISNTSSDYGNNEIALGVTKYLIVDGKNSSEEQQNAAKKFLNYLIYNEKGNKFMTEDAGIIPCFSNLKITSDDSLTKDMINYRDSGKTMEFMNSYLPHDNSKVIGNALKKYLNNEISRDKLVDIVIDFWKTH